MKLESIVYPIDKLLMRVNEWSVTERGFTEAHTSKRLTIPSTWSFPKREDVIACASSASGASLRSAAQKAIFGLGGRGCTFALLTAGLASCASSGALSQKNLDAIAQNSSCEQPYILKYDPETIDAMPSETKDGEAISQENKLLLHQAARLRLMGYEHALPAPKSGCADESITAFTLFEKKQNAAEAPTVLLIKAMTSAQIKADPNIRCKPVYTQVYQPPLKLGGAGKVIQVRNGERCNVEKSDLSSLGLSYAYAAHDFGGLRGSYLFFSKVI